MPKYVWCKATALLVANMCFCTSLRAQTPSTTLPSSTNMPLAQSAATRTPASSVPHSIYSGPRTYTRPSKPAGKPASGTTAGTQSLPPQALGTPAPSAPLPGSYQPASLVTPAIPLPSYQADAPTPSPAFPTMTPPVTDYPTADLINKVMGLSDGKPKEESNETSLEPAASLEKQSSPTPADETPKAKNKKKPKAGKPKKKDKDPAGAPPDNSSLPSLPSLPMP